VKLSKSCVIPSVACDQQKVFVLTSSALEMYSHKGEKMFSWQSNALEYRGPWNGFSDSQWFGRMGGQIALDNSAAATEAFFATGSGYIFHCLVAEDVKASRVTVLVHSIMHSFFGMALQTYHVPGMELQKRLYVTDVFSIPASPLYSIQRINVNALQNLVREHGTLRFTSCDVKKPCALGGKGPFPKGRSDVSWPHWEPFGGNLRQPGTPAFGVGEKDLWNQFARTVNVEFPAQTTRFTRLAYANGKLYYVHSPTRQRATLRSTDVTLFVNCEDAFAIANESFHSWIIPEADYGKSFEATPGQPRIESLHEVSKYAGSFPWQFTAFKKVVPMGQDVIIKEMLCSRPKPPTTRPSQERCCVRKRMEASSNSLASTGSSEQGCTLEALMKQL